MCLLFIHMSLVKWLHIFFAHLLTELSYYWVGRVHLYIYINIYKNIKYINIKCKSFVRYIYRKYLLPLCGLPFHCLNGVFQRAKVLGLPWLKLHAHKAGGMGSIPGQRTKILHATQCGQNPATTTKSKSFYLLKSNLSIFFLLWFILFMF